MQVRSWLVAAIGLTMLLAGGVASAQDATVSVTAAEPFADGSDLAAQDQPPTQPWLRSTASFKVPGIPAGTPMCHHPEPLVNRGP